MDNSRPQGQRGHYQGSNNRQTYNNQQRPNNRSENNQTSSFLKDIIKSMNENKQNALHTWLTPKQFALPEGWSKQIADIAFGGKVDSGKKSVRQLRKTYEQLIAIKAVTDPTQEQLTDTVRNRLYLLLPQINYATARMYMNKELSEIYNILIRPETLQCANDLTTLVQFTETIIAYAKGEVLK